MRHLPVEQRLQHRFLGAELMHHAALAESALARDRIQRQPARPVARDDRDGPSSAALRDRSERLALSMADLSP